MKAAGERIVIFGDSLSHPGSDAGPAQSQVTEGINRLTSAPGDMLASLLLEQALVVGQPTPGGCTFDMPLSRIDMADYLALNPDTLSRHIARLKTLGVLTTPTRAKAIISDLAALHAMTPIADALTALHSKAERKLGT